MEKIRRTNPLMLWESQVSQPPPVISHPICRSIFGANEHQRQGNVRLVPAAESSAHPLLDRGPKTWRFDPGRHQSATPVLPLPAWLRLSSSSAVDDGKGGISEGGLVKSPFLVVHPHFCHKLNTAHLLVGKMIKMWSINKTPIQDFLIFVQTILYPLVI